MHFIKCGADDTERLHTEVLALNTPHFTRRSKISTHNLYIAQQQEVATIIVAYTCIQFGSSPKHNTLGVSIALPRESSNPVHDT